MSSFTWREALTPVHTPPGSRRGGSGASTPRSATPPLTPTRVAPSAAGGPAPGAYYGAEPTSARSSRSNVSARSGISARSVGGGAIGYQGASHDLSSARTAGSYYATPEPSARTSDYASCYDAASACGTARAADVFGGESPADRLPPTGRRRRHNAALSALDAFAEAPVVEAPIGYSPVQASSSIAAAAATEAAAPQSSLDARQVFSWARHGRHREVEASLVEGFDPFSEDSFGNTLFHIACQNGNKRIAKAAIKYGGNMDAQNKKGNTGLHFLFAYGYPDIAEYFIEKGADETVTNELGKSAREGIR